VNDHIIQSEHDDWTTDVRAFCNSDHPAFEGTRRRDIRARFSDTRAGDGSGTMRCE
jgi:hypothetical protein